MRYSQYNRHERKQIQLEKLAQSLKGAGIYVYKNASRTGTLSLPKEIASGRKTVGPGEEFQGDSYFMSLVRTGDLIMVRAIKTAEQDKKEVAAAAAEVVANAAALEAKTMTDRVNAAMALALVEKAAAEECVLSEATDHASKTRVPRKVETVNNQKTKKLVLDQPDRVTNEGKVEHVIRDDGTQKLHDHDNSKRQPDVLLNEHPVGEIIIE